MYINYSRSEGAAEAEARGLLPASRIARQLRVSSRAVAAVLLPLEWHHTGCRFRRTNYYLVEEAAARIADLREWMSAHADEYAVARRERARVKAWRLLLREQLDYVYHQTLAVHPVKLGHTRHHCIHRATEHGWRRCPAHPRFSAEALEFFRTQVVGLA